MPLTRNQRSSKRTTATIEDVEPVDAITATKRAKGPRTSKKVVAKADVPIVLAKPVATGTSKYFNGDAAPIPTPSIAGLVVEGVRLSDDFYDQECITLTRALLGKLLCRRIADGVVVKGRISEAEAYPGGDDRGSYSYMGKRTPGNEPMYMKPGTSFVYFTYGMYHCMNLSSRGEGSAVLIRALEPLQGIEQMYRNRSEKIKSAKVPKEHELCAGPSKMCLAMDIDRHRHNKVDMSVSEDMWIEDAGYEVKPEDIATSIRIGLNPKTCGKAVHSLYRFYLKDCPSVSKLVIKKVQL